MSVVALLFDADDSVLVVIDVQPGFLRKLDRPVAERVVERTRWLVRVAASLRIPVVVTEEEPERHGGTEPTVAAELAPGQVRHRKEVFGLAGDPALVDVLEAHGRRSALLVGLETDVCVAQSALGLVERGWKVGAVSDACAAPGPAHDEGLSRMRGAGVELIGARGLYYEWVRTVGRLDLPGLPIDGPGDLVM